MDSADESDILPRVRRISVDKFLSERNQKAPRLEVLVALANVMEKTDQLTSVPPAPAKEVSEPSSSSCDASDAEEALKQNMRPAMQREVPVQVVEKEVFEE